MKKTFVYSLLLLLVLFAVRPVAAQAPVVSAEEAITGLLNRIGGDGAASKFEIVIDASLAENENGKDVFVITSQNGKPCIKGNTQLSVATGINWYLNHYAHINLTWNNLTTDLSQVELPVPTQEDKHVSSAKYRYNFNTCTFSYSMAFWTWDRWQKEIDWMALHGINAPLNLVGLDVVTRNFLRELGMSESDIDAYIAGPGFIAWFAMNNLEGWGGTINSASTGVDMSGNPDWWYTRQEQLCRNMLQRMRELGMQPVIPGFSGQVPNCIVNYATTINKNIGTFNSGDVMDNGTWAGGYTRPDILKPFTDSYKTLAKVYYKHLEAIMGVSEFYSMDPFHEGTTLPTGITAENTWPNIMAELDVYHNAVNDATKESYNVGTDDGQAKWIIQYWQGLPPTGVFGAMSGYGDRFIGLDLFSDNIYAGNAAKWRGTGNNCYYQGRPYIYCMLHNFGGRSGLHGRLETTMNGYFQALANNNNCQGIGATPEGTETNPILYDMLFELPWMSSNPGADAWLAEYAHSRYGVNNATALEALKNLKKSVWNCEVNQQGTSEAVILARPNWTIGSVSSWSTSAIYWDTQDVRLAADQLISIAELVTENGGKSGVANYNYDAIDVIRQAMVDYAAQLLPLIKTAHDSGDNAEYTRLYQLYLQLMLDLDTMLSYDENFKLERWTSLARNIAKEGDALGYTTTENDRNWLEWNARTQVTVWSKGNTDLHDYSNRCWAGLIKDFHYKRWKHFFENNGNAPSGGWYSGFEYPWTVDFNNVYDYAGDYSEVVIPDDMTATAKAAETFGKYFGRVKGATKNYIFPMGVSTNATKSDVIPEVYRGKEVELPLIIGKEVTISSVWVDLNNDGNAVNGETLTANGNKVTIPADAVIGKTTAKVTYSDGTIITFSLALVEDITEERTVTAVAGANGSVAIEGDEDGNGSITNTEAVKITATANTGYNFENWTDAQGNVVSNDNPFIYYGKDAATFTANFIQDKWGVVADNSYTSELGTIKQYKSYVHNMTFAYYNREAETIYEATDAPTSVFTTIPQIINVPQGASFDVYYDDGDGTGLQYCYFRAYIDLNADGDFDDEGEQLKEVGTQGAENTAVCSNKINVLLPYDAPLGITHMRLRFDGAYSNNEKPADLGAKDGSNRPVYEIILNITDKTDKAAHVVVKTNSEEWGTVEVWTDETPDGSTGTEWDVSSNIPLYLRATKSTPDTEFLGWYDHYGRLLTTELEYKMYAREDATYTAKFRKFLEIDGWQIEYRTEPGTEVTNKLANGEAPVGGKKYYINAYKKQSDGTYASYYLYDNGSSLLTATTVNGESYLWTCIDNGDGTFSFKNENGNYIANTNDHFITSGTVAAKFKFEAPSVAGVSLCNYSDDYTGSRYMVAKYDGSSFNKYANKTNHYRSDTDAWSSDFVFTEVSTPDNVILTKVRQSGNHDLVIPKTVNILGEDLKIVGFDNGLFANNKDLWTITLPSTIETMSSNRVFSTSVKGDGNYPQVFELGGLTLKNNEAWEIIATYKSDGVATFNEWGTPLLYAGSKDTDPELFWLSNVNNWSTCWHVRSPFSGLGNDYFKTHTDSKISTFVAAIENKGTGTAVVKVTNSNGETKEGTVNYSLGELSAFSAKLPIGLDMTNFEVFKGSLPDPFEGCTNLLDITFADGGCQGGYTVDGREFKNASGVVLHTLADEEKEDEIRALGELIDLAEALITEVATNVNPTGKETAIGLQANDPNAAFYVSTNADQNTGGGKTDGAGIAGLVDNSNDTYFHSRWGGTDVNATHHIEVDLGEGNRLSEFKFSYVSANGPDPTKIVVKGSNNGEEFDQIGDIIIKNAINSGATYCSDIIEAEQSYRYLRFEVAESYRWNSNAIPQGEYCFSMKEFDIYDLTSSAEVAPKYANLAGVTAGDVEGVYDSMAEALYFYNNGGTADELQAAYDALKPLYDALNAEKDKILNGVYNINFGGKPLFIAYAAANELNGLTGAGNAGFRLFDATTTNTDSKHSTIQNNAIAAQAPADALFTIVPKDDYSGYHLSAQGNYMRTTSVHYQWDIQAFDTDVANAGVYLFEETATENVFKLKSNKANTNYVNDWGPVFGNDLSSKENLSTFTLTPVTEYTLSVPASGVTALCLPFNVVLPDGVTAYDITEEQISQIGGRFVYELTPVAAGGETLAKNTPVIVKAAEGNHTLTITMSDENVKGSATGTVLRSGLVKTTIDNTAINYTFSNGIFTLVTAATDVAANQCWMELEEQKGTQILDESSYSGAFFYTTDEEAPVLYNIRINRNSDDVLGYDKSDGKVPVQQKTANNIYQTWYFKATEAGVVILPFNADGKVLGANDVTDGAGKVSAASGGTQTYDTWHVVESPTSGWYNIYTVDGSGNKYYFSNHGGRSNKMGFWAGDGNDPETKTKKDGGSQFQFLDAEFGGDNPRYYQLQDLLNTMDVTTQAKSGDAPGCREGGDEHYTAYTAAKALIDDGNTSAYDDCYTAYTSLRETRKALGEMKQPVPGKVYRIRNYISSAVDGHKNHYIANTNVSTTFPTNPDDNTTLWVCVAGANNTFKFVSAMGTAEFSWQAVAENAQEYSVNPGIEQGAVALAKEGNVNLALTNEEHQNGVKFNQASGNVSQATNWSTDWYIEPVDGAVVYYNRSIAAGYNWVTMFLPFSVTVPEGVSAYTAVVSNVQEESGQRYVDLQPVANNRIPARTGVVLYRENNDIQQEFRFDLVSDDVTPVESNIFEGRVTTGAVGGDPDNYNYYLLLRVKNKEAFYWMKEEYNENLGSGTTHIKCEGNKAYMVLPEDVAGSASSFGFRFPGTTDIEEITDNRVQCTDIYDLLGRKLTEITEPGIYIIDGKKVLVK